MLADFDVIFFKTRLRRRQQIIRKFWKQQCGSYKHGNPNGFIRRKSISGLLIDVVSEEPATNYAQLFENLEHYPGYSPPDPTDDVFRPCTTEESTEHFQDNGHGYCYSTIFNGEQCRVELNPERCYQPHTNYTATFINNYKRAKL